MLTNCLAACTHLSSTVSQLFEPQVQKIAVFTYRSPHFCFWRRPCDYHVIYIYTIYNSMLAKRLAACTHLSSTVSQLFEAQVQKNRNFHVPPPTFLFPLETPLRLSRNMLHGWKEFNACQTPRCMYLSIFNSFRVIRCLSQCVSPKNRFFTTFLFPLGTPLGQSR